MGPSRFLSLLILMSASIAAAAQDVPSPSGGAPPATQSMPGMNMPAQMPTGAAKTGDREKDGDAAMHSMEGHMDMGPHMKMTALRPPQVGDAERARQVADTARKAAEKYVDYHVALADGFKIFHPEIPQKMYHFTNYENGFHALFNFDPEHPTSLLYEKHAEDYKLVGVMYTASKKLDEDKLNERIPLSVVQWHEHVNFCAAPEGRKNEYLIPHAQFGLHGSIVTEQACDAAGGTFHPVIFNWMVHVYPFEKDPAAVWSADRQHGDDK